jgi:hypothetical protein
MSYLDNSSPKKIAAIKLLRSECSAGLRDAKEAVERFQHEKLGLHNPDVAKSAAAIYVGPAIKKVIVDFGDGDITVDLEEMQMRVLMDMPVIGLDAARDIIALVEALEAFSSGAKIGVIE